jgi:hydrogenase maturation protease
VRVVDYGIRGMHLAYDLLDGWDALVLVDAVPSRGTPGEVVVLEVGPQHMPATGLDAHAMDPGTVVTCLNALGGTLPPTLLVGCQAADVEEGIGLSPQVEAAVEVAVTQVQRIVASFAAEEGVA